jgi:hypothetical protein
MNSRFWAVGLFVAVLAAYSSAASAACSEWTLTVNVDFTATETSATATAVTVAAMTTNPCLDHWSKLLTAYAELYSYSFSDPCGAGGTLVDSDGDTKYIVYDKVTAIAKTGPDQRGCNTVTWKNKGNGALAGTQQNGESNCQCADCTGGGPGGGPFLP